MQAQQINALRIKERRLRHCVTLMQQALQVGSPAAKRARSPERIVLRTVS